jgi:hypothetical protein
VQEYGSRHVGLHNPTLEVEAMVLQIGVDHRSVLAGELLELGDDLGRGLIPDGDRCHL